ncbi:MAG: Gfo/Idh/MocA family oxidoreductase [Planctomycetaceae bacterium]|jgi:predicted dehydrogenase|nr:Gfo/Idh/MocA family oxidoreductase [Planctomycetaceae bacterium]MBT6154634.1 Gfo/Idh/MocA family oxidoreductase [Planctomycetaceae bacterium]MBT6485373.1 Gfo/Idh/MocA family oxidoreductase [Planctomycetaceae bacterium]MBT6495128.1 Gfo/Idh/MocA family oxidoreductase [Planctomycetaceae bacterium]
MTDNARTINVAIIGGGMFFDDIIGQSFKDFMRGGIAGALTSIGMSHLASAVADVEIRVCAVGTRSEKSGTAGKIVEWFAEEFPDHKIDACYGDAVWQDMLATHKPDVLFVATPDHVHTQPILDALDAGCDVITEKPLCLTTSEADQIIAKAREVGRVVAVDMHKRYDPFVREMMLKAPEQYGPINRVRTVLEEPLEVSSEIFAWVEESNPFTYVGCHWLDVVHHYMDVQPVAVYATGQKNLLLNWDEHHQEIARRRGVDPSSFKRQHAIKTWDSIDVAVTYDNGMRGDYNNNWINPAEFEGAVNQEIELYGIYGRGLVDQQDRGYREAIIGDGSRTRNPSFGGRIQHHGGHLEIFGYGKASIAAGLLAIIRRRILGESLDELDESYPTAASQREVIRVIEAAAVVAEKNYEHMEAGRGTPTTALLTDSEIQIIEP